MKDPRIPIALPSKALFSDAAITFVDEGFWRGSLVLSIGLAKEPRALTSAEFAALIRALLVERSHLDSLHLVRFHGAFLGDLDQAVLASVEAVIKTLRKYAFAIQLETTNGLGWPIFLDDIPWIIVKTRTPEVDVPYNELHLTPEDGTMLVNLIQPMPSVLSSRERFFYIAKTRTTEELADFCARSPDHWALL